MKNLKSIIRVFAASVNAVAASLQTIQGGGGVKIARVQSRVISGCSGVLFAVCGGFAAGVAESANAQTVSAAEGQVYSSLGVIEFAAAFDASQDDITLTLSRSVRDIAADITAAPGSGIPAVYFAAIINNALVDADGGLNADGLPTFNSNAVAAGNTVVFGLIFIGSNPDNNPIRHTVRIYRNGAGAGGLFMAGGEGSHRPTPAVPIRTTATLAANEFFINSSTFMTTALEAGVVGFRAAVCETTHLIAADEITCNPRTAENTTCTVDGEEFIPVDENDATQGGNCGVPPEEEETPDPTTPTCAAAPTNANCRCPADETRQSQNSVFICVADSGTNPGDPAPPESGGDDISDSGDGRNHAPVFVFGGLMLMGAVGYIMSGGDLDAFAFSPSFGYSVNESGYSANTGGRVDFRKGDWSAYWSAGQTNANGEFGEFRYASGGEYKADFWTASFSESVQGETADYDLSLSADLSGGIWSLSPVYRLHSRLEEGESATRNSLNLEGVLEWNRWQIRPSAGFQWRRTEEFADGGKFRLEAVREF